MAFERFKAKHGGAGPFQTAYAALTDDVGLFGRLGLKEQRAETNSLIDSIAENNDDPDVAGFLAAGRDPMTKDQHRAYRSGLEDLIDWHGELKGYDEQIRNDVDRARGQGEMNDLQADSRQERNNMLLQAVKSLGPEKGRQAMLQAIQSGQFFGGESLLEDIETRQQSLEDKRIEVQVGQAQFLRNEGKSAVDRLKQHDAQMTEVASLLGDDSVDITSPVVRGRLTDGLSLNVRTMDPDDWGDALASAGATPLFGPIMALLGGAVSAEDFNLSREDWAKVYRAVDIARRGQYESEIIGLGNEAGELEKAGGGLLGEYGLDDIAMLQEFDADAFSKSPFLAQYDATKPGGGLAQAPTPTTRAELERELQSQQSIADQTSTPVSSYEGLPRGMRERIALVEGELGPLTFDGQNVVDSRGNEVQFGAGELAALKRRQTRTRYGALDRIRQLQNAARLLPQEPQRNTDEYKTGGGFP